VGREGHYLRHAGEVNDNSTVTLTFHFWSGETVTYTLAGSGTTITGTAT
jgi:endoglucanase